MDSEPLGIQHDPQVKFLTDLGTPHETIDHTSTLLRNARRDLGLYFPRAIPKQPSIIIPVQGDDYGNGEYLGELGGNHYLEVEFGKKPEKMSPTKEAILRSLTIHELLHQRQFEIPEIAASITSTLPVILPDAIAALTPQQIVELLRERATMMQISNLQSALIEGSAKQVELYVLRKKIEEARNTGKTETEQLLTKTMAFVLDDMQNNGERFNPYVDGSRIITNVANTHGLENILDVLSEVDWHQCGGIQRGTPEYEAIIQGSTQLPKLNNV